MTSYERGIQVYQVLIACAGERRIIAYELLENKIAVPARSLGAFLGQIAKPCEKNRLPPLTILVAHTGSAKPGEGFKSFEDFPRDRERVFNHNWYKMKPSPSKTSTCFDAVAQMAALAGCRAGWVVIGNDLQFARRESEKELQNLSNCLMQNALQGELVDRRN